MQMLRSLSPQDAKIDSQDWRERKSCFDESPGAHLTISVLAGKSHRDGACSSRETSSWIKEKRGGGSPGSAVPARRVSTPGGGSCIPSLGPGRGGSWDESTTKKKLLKKLAVSVDVAPPRWTGLGTATDTGHLQPKSWLRRAGEAQEQLSIPGSAATAAGRAAEQQMRPGRPGAPVSGTGTSGD